VENDMTERDQARAAQTKVGRGDWIPRPTKAEVLADVPGARNVKPELLPEGVQHLSNVSAGVVARDPNVAVGVIVEGLATDPKRGWAVEVVSQRGKADPLTPRGIIKIYDRIASIGSPVFCMIIIDTLG
jgi:hypothetical protein